jgi:hypothetical protein
VAIARADDAGGPGRLTADDVDTLVIPGSGRWLAEQVLAVLTSFLEPYRNGLVGQSAPGPVVLGDSVMPARSKEV